jgi:hypothetical protein
VTVDCGGIETVTVVNPLILKYSEASPVPNTKLVVLYSTTGNALIPDEPDVPDEPEVPDEPDEPDVPLPIVTPLIFINKILFLYKYNGLLELKNIYVSPSITPITIITIIYKNFFIFKYFPV